MSLEIEYDIHWYDNLISIHRPRKKDHNQIILDQIQEMIDKYGIEPNAQGYYYDFDIPKYPRTYEDMFRKITQPVIDAINDKYYTTTMDLSRCWFQQYVEETAFGWHTHAKSHFAIVYYPELPNGQGTQFRIDGLFHENLKEGDVLVFPAFLPHRSAPLEHGRKTIISCNTNLDAFREEWQ